MSEIVILVIIFSHWTAYHLQTVSVDVSCQCWSCCNLSH